MKVVFDFSVNEDFAVLYVQTTSGSILRIKINKSFKILERKEIYSMIPTDIRKINISHQDRILSGFSRLENMMFTFDIKNNVFITKNKIKDQVTVICSLKVIVFDQIA